MKRFQLFSCILRYLIYYHCINQHRANCPGSGMDIIDEKRRLLGELIDHGQLSQHQIEEAKIVIGYIPAANDWRDIINTLLFWIGILSLSFGVIFFIAANWDEFGQSAKFILAQSVVIGSVVAYWMLHHKPIFAKGCLTIAVLSVGALMALFGQTYQTGADPWQLFFNWAVVIIPFVLISRFTPIYFMWFAIINLAGMLYFELYFRFETAYLVLGASSILMLVAWQFAAKKYAFLDKSWAIAGLSMYAAFIATSNALVSIFGNNIFYQTDVLNFFVWVAFILIVFLFFYRTQRNLFVIACACLSTIIVANSLVLKGIDDDLGFFITTILTIGLGTASTFWLKTLYTEQNQTEYQEQNHE